MQLCRSRESTWSLWRRSCKTHVFPSRFSVFLVKDLLLIFHFDSFNLGGKQPGWEGGERYFVLCWCKFKELLLSLRPFSGLIFIKENFINLSFQTDRVCWFAGWPCRMFCSNLCLSERNASGRFFFLSPINQFLPLIPSFSSSTLRSTTTRTWPRRSWWRSTRTTRRASSTRTSPSQSLRLERVPELIEKHNCCQDCERIHLIQNLSILLSMSLWSKPIDTTQISRNQIEWWLTNRKVAHLFC